MLTEKDVLQALSQIKDPQSGQPLPSLKIIRNLKVEGSKVAFSLAFKEGSDPRKDELIQKARTVIEQLEGVEEVSVSAAKDDPLKVISSQPAQAGSPPRQPRQAPPQQQQQPQKMNLIPQAKNTIAVASGKGGVGKTTVAVNLAIALAKTGASVGLLDADIYGPNIPMMMGVHDRLGARNNKIAPLERHNVRMVSVGFIAQGDTAMIWRGPIVSKMIQQFLQDVDWGELDYLVIDLPPGTGDAQLTLTQAVPLTGAIVVSTPQDVALSDAKKGVNMFRKVEVPVLGIVENMSYFVCPHCNERTEIFDHGGGKKASEEFKVPFLGEIPLDAGVRIGGDRGEPIVVSHPDSAVAQAFMRLAQTVMDQIGQEKQEDEGFLKRVFKLS